MGRYPFIILCLLGGAKETDLIYEGIATCAGFAMMRISLFSNMKETDLIYEGIATVVCLPSAHDLDEKETDLIYEGIATSSFFRFFNNMVERN